MKRMLILLLVVVGVYAGSPIINGFFIQPSLGYGVTGFNSAGKAVFDSQDSYDRWVSGMASIGCEMLFYQWSVHYWADQTWFSQAYGTPASADFAFYDIAPHTINGIPTQSWTKPTKWLGAEVEPLKRALDACQKAGIKLWLGLYLNENPTSFNWWDATNDETFTSKDTAIIDYHIARSLSIIDELSNRFGSHPAFGGFYYSIEIANLGFTPKKNWPLLAHLIDTVADRVHQKIPGAELALSPFFNTAGSVGGSGLGTAAQFGEMWDSVVSIADLDILILQDGVGVDPFSLTATEDRITPYYRSVKEACAKNGVRFWANCELFTNKGSRLSPKCVPSSIESVVRQLKTEMPYAEKSVCFSYEYLDPNPDHTFPRGTFAADSIAGGEQAARLKLYTDYKNYRDTLSPTSIEVAEQNDHSPSVNFSGSLIRLNGISGSVPYRIVSITGKIVQCGESFGTIDLKSLGSGTYIISITAQKSISAKFILK